MTSVFSLFGQGTYVQCCNGKIGLLLGIYESCAFKSGTLSPYPDRPRSVKQTSRQAT